MADDPVIPANRLGRWLVLAALIVAAIVLYFQDGRELAPLGAAAAQVEAR